jgi:hypothetical protein
MAECASRRASWQHLLNHQRTSQILCLPYSDSFQTYGPKPMRGHMLGKPKMMRRQAEQPNPLVWPRSVLKVTAGLKFCGPLGSRKAVQIRIEAP